VTLIIQKMKKIEMILHSVSYCDMLAGWQTNTPTF
jgi:hypothetical protein